MANSTAINTNIPAHSIIEKRYACSSAIGPYVSKVDWGKSLPQEISSKKTTDKDIIFFIELIKITT